MKRTEIKAREIYEIREKRDRGQKGELSDFQRDFAAPAPPPKTTLLRWQFRLWTLDFGL
jgi:phosphatidylethanolamine-binding protein (PEBP) family uncharacterized protein